MNEVGKSAICEKDVFVYGGADRADKRKGGVDKSFIVLLMPCILYTLPLPVLVAA